MIKWLLGKVADRLLRDTSDVRVEILEAHLDELEILHARTMERLVQLEALARDLEKRLARPVIGGFWSPS